MRALITGSEGFIGKHLTAELENNGYEVVRCDLHGEAPVVPLNILDQEAVLGVISRYRPDVLINMAGQANVGLSWKKPQMTLEINTVGTLNLLEAIRAVKPEMRVIAVGSSDEYGVLLDRGINVTEDMEIHPTTPYAISKQAQEEFCQLYCRAYGMNICMTRQFNLGGAGQAKGFMISDFASGIAEIEAGRQAYLSVGNLQSARDFTHVKDACRAVRLIAEKGHAGEIYNICSGKTYTAQEVLDRLINMSQVSIEVRTDPARMRPSDTPVICGNHDKLTAHTGWEPEKSMVEILTDALNYWRSFNGIGKNNK